MGQKGVKERGSLFENCVSKRRNACYEMISGGIFFNRGELPRKSNVHTIRMISKEYGVRSSPSRRAAASPSIWHGCPRAHWCKAIWLVLLRMAKSFYDDESKSDVNFSQMFFKFLSCRDWSKDRLENGELPSP